MPEHEMRAFWETAYSTLIGDWHMEAVSDLIQRQTSYSERVVWMQAKERCNYLEACLKVNAALQHYRSRYAASDAARFYNQR